MKVLLTGGGGFIGSAVKEQLAIRSHVCKSFDLPNDIRSRADLRVVGRGCDAVIHLAGVLGTHELFDTPELAVDVNVKGTLNVLDWCKDTGARYVGITMPQVFPSIYTATKVAATRLASAYHHTHGVPVSHVRAFNAFGPGQKWGPGHPQKIVPTFAIAALRGEPMPVWGDGSQGVDLIYTPDLARMLVEALEFGDDDVFDGGSGTMWTVNQVAHLVAEAAGTTAQIDYLPMRRGETPTHIVAKGEGWDKLKWSPKFWTADLVETVRWYKRQLEA
jgi:UDP-glucose 4-epimerase